MNNWEQDISNLNKIGVATFSSVPKDIISYLQLHIDNRKKLIKYNQNLAGHIKNEKGMKPSTQFNSFMLDSIFSNDICKDKMKSFDFLNKNVPLYTDNIWFNFQKKYEFNPIHHHYGLFSFIIFMQIPYDLKKEDKVFSEVREGNTTVSRLAFVYTDIDGAVTEKFCNVDSSYVHKMVIFSADLRHLVYPFYTSNKERITVSGNIKLWVN